MCSQFMMHGQKNINQNLVLRRFVLRLSALLNYTSFCFTPFHSRFNPLWLVCFHLFKSSTYGNIIL